MPYQGQPPTLRVAEAIKVCNQIFAELDFIVEGEVASFSVSKGKFVFFDLKDEEEEARLSCFMMAYQLPAPLEDGMRVVVSGKAGLYQKSGQFRLSVTRVEPKGVGSVKRAFDLLVAKLEKEGLFARDRKRLLPRFVSRVGIISSVDAAGFGDFKKIALQRLPGISFIMTNVAVQGRDAEAEICRAFDHLNESYDLDAIVLIRGGGSIEDLHAFNSEQVARAIVRSKAPVVVGVGHERDITVADFCADVRAATPSNAAQLLLPTKEEVAELVLRLTQQGRRQVEKAVQSRRDRIAYQLRRMSERLQFAVIQKRQRVDALVKTIEALSPQRTLERGYSITCVAGGKSVMSPTDVVPGDRVTTRTLGGTFTSVVSES